MTDTLFEQVHLGDLSFLRYMFIYLDIDILSVAVPRFMDITTHPGISIDTWGSPDALLTIHMWAFGVPHFLKLSSDDHEMNNSFFSFLLHSEE